MKDIFGTQVETGDIIAVPVSNTGLQLRVVIDAEKQLVKGSSGGQGKIHYKSFLKVETSQLQNDLGYKMLDIAFKERQKQ